MAASSATPGAARLQWVERTLASLSLREKLGQMLMLSCFGEFTQAESPSYQDLIRQVEKNQVGGFLLAARRGPLGIQYSQAYPSAVLLNDLQRRSSVPLFVSADFEQGAGMRVVEGTSFPSAMALAATARPEDAATLGRITALEARAIGVNWIFAPVVDVNVNPANPIINIRSFGEDPAFVGQCAAAFIRAVESSGLLSTAKHFPGHGDVTSDSHLVLPTVGADRDRLQNVEWPPFRAAIAAGVSAVMTGHLSIPAFESPAVPATFSNRLLRKILRGELKFDGLIAADALGMGAIASLFSGPEAAVRAAIAGVDVLLLPPNPDAALHALEGAVRSGRLPESRVEESARRILLAKSRFAAAGPPQVDVSAVSASLRRPEFIEAAEDIAARGITLLRNRASLLPLGAAKPPRLLLVALSGDPDPCPGEALEHKLLACSDSVAVLRADTRFAAASSLHFPSADSYDVMVIALFVHVADGKGTVALPEQHAAVVHRLLSAEKPVAVLCFGNPYLIAQFPAASTWVASFSSVEACQHAAARALFGEIPVRGLLPVTVPGVAARGDGLQIPSRSFVLVPEPTARASSLVPTCEILERAVAERAFPGGVLAVGRSNEVFIHPFGGLTYGAGSPAVREDTIYDLASLTKPIVTAASIFLLAESDHLSLDAPVSRYLPEWNAAPDSIRRASVILRHLLLHSSGLPAYREYFRAIQGKQAILNRVLSEPLIADPGERVVYSDLGFILLGDIVERLSGESLDDFARQRIFDPLSMTHSIFRPPPNLRPAIAPTENDTTFRHRLLHGEVDDANAFAMGGVAGHAGLFSTAGDLAVFAQMMLQGGAYGQRRIFRRSAVSQMTRRVSIGASARALGWDVPIAPSSSGQYFPPESFGHTGYTGCSLWIDPVHQLFVILLTNRVHPDAANQRIRDVRPQLHDAVMAALGFAPLSNT